MRTTNYLHFLMISHAPCPVDRFHFSAMGSLMLKITRPFYILGARVSIHPCFALPLVFWCTFVEHLSGLVVVARIETKERRGKQGFGIEGAR